MTENTRPKDLNGENSPNSPKKGETAMSSDEKEQKRISRREFVKGAAVGAAGAAAAGALAGCGPEAPAPTPEVIKETVEVEKVVEKEVPVEVIKEVEVRPWLPEKWDYEADVVVVGFGGAGGSAAIEAHDAGAKVIILEKTPTPGGSTTLCAGIYYGAGTSLQKAEGITDTADEMYKYVLAMGRGKSAPENLRVWADKSAETFEWIKGLGATFYTGVNYIQAIPPRNTLAELEEGWALYYSGAECDPEYAAITPPKPRGHIVRPATPTYPYPPEHPTAPPVEAGLTRGTGWFTPLWEGAKARGIQVLLETRAMALVTDPLTNAVLGVKAESNGNTLYIKARRAVHLACGGFVHNKEMCKIWCPEALGGVNFTASDTGDGHLMGMAIGAAVVNMDQALMSFSVPSGAIAVNFGGRRYTDETAYRDDAEQWMGQRNSLAFGIFDEAIREAAGVTETIQAPTIGELAGEIGIDPAVLEDTVNFYNSSVALGKDREFARTQRDSQKHPPDEVVVPPERAMVPIKTAPFHAVRRDRSNFTATITMGGLRINTKAQVIDVYGKVIPRLYAAGTTSGATIGEMYVGSGHAISQALNFGRIAGENAAKETPWE